VEIDAYDFGRIIIGGRPYTSDVLLLPGEVYSPWWRKEGHAICLEDLERALAARPRLLVVGTGFYGMVKVPPQLLEVLKERGIETIVQGTVEACQTYNRLCAQGGVVAALHLTC
jgi:hypothetical protein